MNIPFSSAPAALYMRISKEDADYPESASIENQRKILRAYANEHNIDVFAEYIDATVIIGLKQNPTIGRRFSPIFSFIEHLSGKYGRCYT